MHFCFATPVSDTRYYEPPDIPSCARFHAFGCSIFSHWVALAPN